MKLSAHQPAYLPWLGFFDKIGRSDVFVYLDAVQFEKNSFTNRNRIKTLRGPIWLTVPVKLKGHTSSTMKDTLIDNTQNWRMKHLRSIAQSYGRAPFFGPRYPRLEALYEESFDRLSDMCFSHLQFWLSELGIERRIIRQSELPEMGLKSELVLNLCRHLGADCYLSGALGRAYLDLSAFRASGIRVELQDYRHPVYPQLHGDFLPNLAIVDLWMNASDPPAFWQGTLRSPESYSCVSEADSPRGPSEPA